MSKTKVNSHVKAVLFDLGNTLYDKEQYLKVSFDNVAAHLEEKLKLEKKITLKLLNRIWKIRTSHYEFLFKDLLEIFGIYSAKSLDELISVYHNTKGKLLPYKGVTQLLDYLKKKYKIGLVTDGHPQMQRNKVKLLGWDKPRKPFDVIIYTADYDKSYMKPNPFVYQLAAEKLGVTPKETVFVGDNPYDDFVGAKEIGIFTVRVLQGEFKSIRLDKSHEADVVINDITQLKKIL